MIEKNAMIFEKSATGIVTFSFEYILKVHNIKITPNANRINIVASIDRGASCLIDFNCDKIDIGIITIAVMIFSDMIDPPLGSIELKLIPIKVK